MYTNYTVTSHYTARIYLSPSHCYQPLLHKITKITRITIKIRRTLLSHHKIDKISDNGIESVALPRITKLETRQEAHVTTLYLLQRFSTPTDLTAINGRFNRTVAHTVSDFCSGTPYTAVRIDISQ